MGQLLHQVPPQHQVRPAVIGGGVPVEDDQLGPGPHILHQPGHGVHHQRGARHQQQVRLLHIADGLAQVLLVEALPIEHHVRPDGPPAGAAGHAGSLGDAGHVVPLPAGEAGVPVLAAVKLQHVPAARHLVEAVNVLGDDGPQLALPLQLGQGVVGAVGLGVGVEHHAPEEVVKLRCVADEIPVGEHLLVGEALLFLLVQAVGAAEIRDAAGGGDARPAQEHRALALLHPLAQALPLRHAGAPPFSSSSTGQWSLPITWGKMRLSSSWGTRRSSARK